MEFKKVLSTSVFLTNKLSTSILKFKSPFECLTSRKPDYKFLKTYGCACFPLISKNLRNKFDYNSVSSVFIGYSTKHMGYLCLNIKIRKIIVSRR